MYIYSLLWKKMSVLRKDKEGISMNLPEALVYADINHLNRIAQHYDLTVNLSSKNSLIQSILQLILDKRNLEQQISKLTVPEERYLITLLCESIEQYTIEDLLAKATNVLKMEGMKQLDVTLPSNRGLVNMLLNNGWLYVNKRDRQQLYSLPKDLREKLINGIKQLDEDIENKFSFVENDFKNDLLLDIKTYLEYLSQDIVYLTTEGVIHKRQLQQLLKKFIIFESPIEGKQWRFGYGRRFPQYPNRFAIIYDFLYAQSYIKEDNNCLYLTKEGELLLSGEKSIALSDVYNYWLKLYKTPIRNLSILVSLIALYCYRWISIDELENKIIDYVNAFYYDSKIDVLQKRVIQPLLWFDLLRIEEEDSKQYVKATPALQAITRK